jgi:hypothetical protein
VSAVFELVLRTWCECSCGFHFCSLHSALANLTINMQLFTLQVECGDFAAAPLNDVAVTRICVPCQVSERVAMLQPTHSLLVRGESWPVLYIT